MEQKEQKTVYTGSAAETARLFGAFDANMKIVEDTFGVTVHNRASDSGNGDALIISGDSHEAVEGAAEAVEALRRSASGMGAVSEQTVLYVSSMVRDGRGAELAAFDENCICLTSKGKPVKPKTVGQRQYVESIRKNTIVLGVGPAGTGKTFLAVARLSLLSSIINIFFIPHYLVKLFFFEFQKSTFNSIPICQRFHSSIFIRRLEKLIYFIYQI